RRSEPDLRHRSRGNCVGQAGEQAVLVIAARAGGFAQHAEHAVIQARGRAILIDAARCRDPDAGRLIGGDEGLPGKRFAVPDVGEDDVRHVELLGCGWAGWYATRRGFICHLASISASSAASAARASSVPEPEPGAVPSGHGVAVSTSNLRAVTASI